ncbi:MAG TPA: hypothetical protein VF571_09235 [Pyrinomonadaceae bacterium]|jgi:hypothetical protein
MTYDEAKQQLCDQKLNGTYSDIANNDLFTDTNLGDWIKSGVRKAWDYKPWDFTEGSKTTTTIDTEYYDYPVDFQSGSIHLLKINGKEYKKIAFQDYLKFQEDYPSATNRFYSEQKRFYFVNRNAYSVGETLDIYGKLMPPILSNASDLLPFSPDSDNYEHSGNEAIVLLAYSEALSSEKYKNQAQAEIERGKAYQMLDLIWEPMEAARSLLQSKNRPFMNVPNFFGNSAAQSIGNFDYLN